MTEQADFTRAFARLVSLLAHQPALIAEQKEALRVALSATRARATVVSLSELNRSLAFAAELQPRPPELPDLTELVGRMAGHSVSLLDIAQNANATDVLGVARMLTDPPVHGDEGAHFDARLVALAPRTVSVRLGRGGFMRRATPGSLPRIAVTPDAAEAKNEERPAQAPPPGTRGEAGQIVESAFSRPRRTRGLAELLGRLDDPLSTTDAHRLLDELARVTEQYALDGMWTGVVDVLARMIARESLESDASVRRSFIIQLRRLLKPELLRGVAGVLGKRREMRESIEDIFRRAGEQGVDVLIELMVTSNLTSERRAYRSALARCPEAAMPVMHLLGDSRWYVVRNAADLLGEMQVLESDVELIGALKHSDARVRRSTVGALARLATTRALGALRQMLGDASAGVRLQAVRGLAAGGSVRFVPALLQALDSEQDVEVQHAILAALGVLASDGAVERLIKAAQPGSMLNRRASGFRVAAVNALRDAGTHAAAAALRRLAGDKDREVRAAVEQALAMWRESARAARETSTVAG